MRNLSLAVAVALSLAYAGSATAQGWREFSSPADYFGINFPDEPAVTEFVYESEFGAVFPGKRFSAQVGASRYSLSVVDFTDSQQIHASMDKTEAASGPSNWLYDQRASVARAAREFRQRGGEVTYDAWSHLDRVEGHQIQLTNADGSRTFAGIYLNSNRQRLYIAEVTVPAKAPPPIQFQQSLHFLDDDGERIRYQLSTNGCVVDPENPRIELLSVR